MKPGNPITSTFVLVMQLKWIDQLPSDKVTKLWGKIEDVMTDLRVQGFNQVPFYVPESYIRGMLRV